MISVIVPVFNVEKYINQCIDSILNQTYHDIEIILVDDGSTDSSGKICDEYQKKDNRIIVIHKSNGGLSSARNAGVEIATGEYISFIDSDDWVENDFLESLYNCCIMYQAEIAVCRIQKRVEENQETQEYENFTECWSGRLAVENRVLKEKIYCIQTSVWNKLYSREIIKDMSFPEGKYYEDIVYSTQAMLNSERVAYTNDALYNYRQDRPGSIMNEGFNTRAITDELPLMYERNLLIRQAGLVDVADLVDRNYCIRVIEIARQLFNSKRISDKKLYYKKCKLYFKLVYKRCSHKYFSAVDFAKVKAFQVNIYFSCIIANMIHRD